MNHELYEEAIHSDVLSEKLISQLLESMEYSSISFINWSIEVKTVNTIWLWQNLPKRKSMNGFPL